MITYDYHCDANGETITVSHSIKETLTNWGQLCSLANHSMGQTPPHTPIRRLISSQETEAMNPHFQCFQNQNQVVDAVDPADIIYQLLH